MLAEATRQAGIREARFVRAGLAPETQPFPGKDGIGDIDERGLRGNECQVRIALSV
jgi:hypothetical protein